MAMTRRNARRIAFELLYAMDSRGISPDEAWDLLFDEEHYDSLAEEDELFAEKPDEKQEAYIRSLIYDVSVRRDRLDEELRAFSGSWRLERLNRVTLTILRLALSEIRNDENDISTAVAVNEAVELAKLYDSPESAAYVNGVLGSLLRSGGENL